MCVWPKLNLKRYFIIVPIGECCCYFLCLHITSFSLLLAVMSDLNPRLHSCLLSFFYVVLKTLQDSSCVVGQCFIVALLLTAVLEPSSFLIELAFIYAFQVGFFFFFFSVCLCASAAYLANCMQQELWILLFFCFVFSFSPPAVSLVSISVSSMQPAKSLQKINKSKVCSLDSNKPVERSVKATQRLR